MSHSVTFKFIITLLGTPTSPLYPIPCRTIPKIRQSFLSNPYLVAIHLIHQFIHFHPRRTFYPRSDQSLSYPLLFLFSGTPLSPNLLLNLLSFLVPSSLHQAKSKVSPARIVEISDIALSLVPPCQPSEDLVIEQGICYTEVHPRTLPLSPPQHSNKLFFTTKTLLSEEDRTLGTA